MGQKQCLTLGAQQYLAVVKRGCTFFALHHRSAVRTDRLSGAGTMAVPAHLCYPPLLLSYPPRLLSKHSGTGA